ncbi:MAG: hypothetical protein RR135_02895 [Oscillospiraceae bacterium]
MSRGRILLPQQQQALQRVREMQARAQRTVEESNMRTSSAIVSEQMQQPMQQPTQQPMQQPRRPQGGGILGQLFGGGQHPQHNSEPVVAAGVGHAQQQGRGLLDLLHGKGLTDSLGGLGETLHTTLSSVSEPLSKLMDTFDIDGEKLIILMVMWIVFNEKGDKTLLMALGYLLL